MDLECAIGSCVVNQQNEQHSKGDGTMTAAAGTRVEGAACPERRTNRNWPAFVVLIWSALIALGLVMPFAAHAADYTWDGDGDGVSWDDEDNWGGSGYPSDGLDRAWIMEAATITSGVPSSINQIYTGSGAVAITYSGSLSFNGIGGAVGPGRLDVGAGGLAFSNATLTFPHGNSVIAIDGDLTAVATAWGNTGSINQSGGLFYIDTFRLPLAGSIPIKNWQFGGTSPATFASSGTTSATHTFTGTPVFQAGHRPNWSLSSGVNATGNLYDLNGYTILGNTVTLTQVGGLNRHAYLFDDVGGTIDANQLVIHNTSYLNLENTSITLRGSGTIYDNRSINNDGAAQTIGGNPYTPAYAFDITQNTTVTLAPTGGTADIDTGSFDFGSSLGEGSFFLGNEDNFAFDVLEIAEGAVITMVGTANWNGGGTNALYANSLIGLGAGATLDLNGHNVYLLNEPVNMTFTGAGGVFVVPEPTTVGLFLSLLALFSLRRPRRRPLAGMAIALAAVTLLMPFALNAADYTWTGDGDGFTWTDPLNWGETASYPGDTTGLYDRVWIMEAATITAGVPSNLGQLHTGSGAVAITHSGAMNFRQNSTPFHYGHLIVGSGGLSIPGTTLAFPNGNSIFSIEGDITATGMSFSNTNTITQTAGQYDIANFRFPGNNGGIFAIQSWNFASGQPTRIGEWGTPLNHYRFDGTPAFQAGHRPNWDLGSGFNETGNRWDLNGQAIVGDTVRLFGGGSPTTRHAYLFDTVGGEVDANTLIIGGNNYIGGYLHLHNTSITLRGSGTIYDNRSINNDGSAGTIGGNPYTPVHAFDITNSTVILDPTDGSASISTGSKDRGGASAADWADNFAFGDLRITEDSTITVTGTANIEGGGDSAVYVKGTLYGEHNSTIDGGRNIYVYGGLAPGSSAGTMNIVGNLLLGENAVSIFDLSDPNVVGGGINDLVNVDGDLTLDGLLEVDLDDPMLLANYTLFTYTGTLTDNGMILNTMLPKPAFIDTSVNGIVTLNVVPEPTSGILLALAGLALLKRQRRRK